MNSLPGSLPNTTNTRVWLIKNRSGPENAPLYQGCMRGVSATRPKGEPTIVTCPDPNKYGRFKTVDKVPGEDGLPELAVQARYQDQISDLLKIVNKGCDIDLLVHVGRCGNPQDFNKGWDKILALEAAQPGDWSVPDLGALEQGDQNPILEEMTFRGEDMYEISKMVYEEQAETETVQEIIAIMVCDAVSCGDCENPSEGCEKVFALTLAVGGSPGARAEIIYTEDAGTTWADTEVDTLQVDRDPSDMACIGANLVVISNDDDALHWASRDDILNAAETWARMATGFVAAGSPTAIFSLSPRHTWIVGDGGYVYFTEDPTASVTVQTAGTVTSENLTCLHGYDTENILAGGNNNALIITRNGGDTWATITGPTAQAAVNIEAVWMRGVNEWWVAYADGAVYYTLDGGDSWTQKTLPGQTALNRILDIKFTTPLVGWISARTTATAARIYRTINGGYEWYIVPEGKTSLPAADYLNEIAVCIEDVNTIYAGGLADDAADGIIVKGKGSDQDT